MRQACSIKCTACLRYTVTELTAQIPYHAVKTAKHFIFYSLRNETDDMIGCLNHAANELIA